MNRSFSDGFPVIDHLNNGITRFAGTKIPFSIVPKESSASFRTASAGISAAVPAGLMPFAEIAVLHLR